VDSKAGDCEDSRVAVEKTEIYVFCLDTQRRWQFVVWGEMVEFRLEQLLIWCLERSSWNFKLRHRH
jgi:hypothetical protein